MTAEAIAIKKIEGAIAEDLVRGSATPHVTGVQLRAP